ncbi:MAG: glycosyl hydrolase family 28 protein [Pirellulales bacterium]|nr:glycosyl hydrolase family 28 protein [Pirellulales bacterium]
MRETGNKTTCRQWLGCFCCGMVLFVGMGAIKARADSEGRVVTYPAPAGEAATEDYRVEVDGNPVDVYRAETEFFDKKYYFASFDFSGEVTVRVTSPQSLEGASILPERFGIRPTLEKPNALTFTASKPFRIAIERDGRNSPLLLFANPLETDPPKPDDPNGVYFGPGIHNPVNIRLTDNQTLYLAGGAVVKGAVRAEGENITVRGRGILDGNEYPHLKGPGRFMLDMTSCKNLVVRDVILRGSWTWALVPNGCDGVLIDNVKICGSRVLNDDGIDLVNSCDVTIRNCFIRTQDDCIAIKGLTGHDRKACEKMTIEACEFWTDLANVFRIGYECETELMQDLTARDIDVLHYSPTYRKPEEFWSHAVFFLQPSDDMVMRRMRFENFRINADGGDIVLVLARPMVCAVSGRKYTRAGRLSECVFKDISVTGRRENFRGEMRVVGYDEEHAVEDLTFENVVRFGEVATADSPDVTIGDHTRNIRFGTR